MSSNDKVLILCDISNPTTLDQDYTLNLKDPGWETERSVCKALKFLKIPFELLAVFDDTKIISEKIKEFQPTVIFNLVERFNNIADHDRDIASFLKLQNIPFTGCGPTGLTLCKNKGLSKKILSYHNIRVPEFIVLPKKKKIQRPKQLKFPILIKPLQEEASYGISQNSFVETDEQFNERIKFIHEKMDQDAIAEEYIEGREIYISILGNKRLDIFPFRELIFTQVPDDEPKIATYKAKWDMKYRKKWGIRNQFVRNLKNGNLDQIQDTCKQIYHLLGIKGYARLDMRLTPEGDIVFLEANPNPILCEWEDFAESAKKGNIPYPELIKRIMNLSHG